jgi:hypothetical protein
MSQLFRRIYKVTFFLDNEILAEYEQSLQEDGLRMNFHVRQQFNLVNTMGEIQLFNLSPDSRSLLREANRLTLEVGYDKELKLLHDAQIINILDVRRQPDYMTLFITLDYLGRGTPINALTPASFTDRQVIKAIAAQVPGIIVNDNNLLGLTDLPTAQRIIIDRLTYLAAFERLKTVLNLNIWLTNNVLYTSSTTPTSVAPPGKPITILNYKNGMVGSPIIDVANSGILVSSLMNSNLIPGNYVKVETIAPQITIGAANYVKFNQEAATRGEWQIMLTDHTGDSRGGDWNSTVQAYGAKNLFTGVQ